MSTRTQKVFARLTGGVPDVVYHYCGPEALAGIVQFRQIWATSAHHLNDLSERIFAGDLLRSIAKELALKSRSGFEFFEATPAALLVERAVESISYVSCFSKNGDLLSQWRAYSPSTGGFAVGIRTSSLASGGDWLFGQCEYDRSSQTEAVKSILHDHPRLLDPSSSLDQLTDASDPEVSSFIAALLTLVPLLKHPGFREEAEWRVVRGPIEAENHEPSSVYLARPSFRTSGSTWSRIRASPQSRRLSSGPLQMHGIGRTARPGCSSIITASIPLIFAFRRFHIVVGSGWWPVAKNRLQRKSSSPPLN